MAVADNETRLRYAVSKDPEMFQPFLDRLGYRVMIYQMQFAGGKWWLWYVPDDKWPKVIDNIDLDQ